MNEVIHARAAHRLVSGGGFYVTERLAYDLRVLRSRYLWGSEQMTVDNAVPLVLHIGNSELGDDVELRTETAAGVVVNLGQIGPGQYASISIQGIRGVIGLCKAESLVTCIIR